MNKAISPQQLAVAPVRRRAASVGPPKQASPPADSVPKPGIDRVTISASARAHQSSAAFSVAIQSVQTPATTPATPTPYEAQVQEAMNGLRASFFSRSGDDNFNASFDFNSDGVINPADLGMMREKLAGGAGINEPVIEPAQTDPEPAPPTLGEIRDAFFTRVGDDNFNAAADLNGDGVVNPADLGMFRQSMSTPSTPPVVTTNTGTLTLDTAHTTQPVPDVVESVGVGSSASVESVEVSTSVSVDLTATISTQPPSVDMESVAENNGRENVLAQLRSAFFSSRGGDRFQAGLDVNGDGRINVADFASARFASHSVSEDNS